MQSTSITLTARAGRSFAPFVRREMRKAIEALRLPLRELSIALVNDREMSRVHERFMNEPAPTDVLTFALEVDSRGMTLGGEIVICVPEARRRARIEGTSIQDELLLYAIHGLLHLSGHDDRTERGYRKMHQIEDKILTQLGIGPVFKPQAKRRRRK
jgi:probable rRNA maturation factor